MPSFCCCLGRNNFIENTQIDLQDSPIAGQEPNFPFAFLLIRSSERSFLCCMHKISETTICRPSNRERWHNSNLTSPFLFDFQALLLLLLWNSIHFFILLHACFWSLFHLHQTLTLADVSIDLTWCHHFEGMYKESPGSRRHSIRRGASSKNAG